MGSAYPSSARKPGKQKLALSEGNVSQESWPTWEPNMKLISDLDKRVHEKLPRHGAEGAGSGGEGKKGAVVPGPSPTCRAKVPSSTLPHGLLLWQAQQVPPLNSCTVHSLFKKNTEPSHLLTSTPPCSSLRVRTETEEPHVPTSCGQQRHETGKRTCCGFN